MIIHGESIFTFNVVQENTHKKQAVVTIPNDYVDALYNHALSSQKLEVETYGFAKGETPLYYIENNFRPNIIEHLKELFFTHCIMNFLYQSLHKNKIVVIGEPILLDVKLKPKFEAQYLFGMSPVTLENEDRWRKLSLKAPERKNYKDLDRQVEFFIKEETENFEKNSHEEIKVLDWVCFELMIVDNNNNSLLKNYKDQLWIRISDEEADRELQELFLGKKIGDSFTSDNVFLQEYISNNKNIGYQFKITIKDIIPHAYFSFEHFKKHFQLKSSKDTHLKLIEVFSYRNDLSQRRETIEVTLKLLLKHYFIPIPSYLLERQKKMVLNAVHANPDYHVYKAKNDFKEKIKQLAEKQLKETIIIDAIAYQENLSVTHEDLLGYINLIKRPRTKEFIYFDFPITKFKGQEIPVSTEMLKKYCLREKTLNHVINQLTKKI